MTSDFFGRVEQFRKGQAAKHPQWICCAFEKDGLDQEPDQYAVGWTAQSPDGRLYGEYIKTEKTAVNPEVLIEMHTTITQRCDEVIEKVDGPQGSR